MHLFKNGVLFIWDDKAKQYFDALKKSLNSTPLLSPTNYNRDFLLYLASSDTTIGMVLVQIDDHHTEHVIYYLSKGLVSTELHYPYIDKLALATTYVVQCFFHYIILQTTMVVFEVNTMQYILSL